MVAYPEPSSKFECMYIMYICKIVLHLEVRFGADLLSCRYVLLSISFIHQHNRLFIINLYDCSIWNDSGSFWYYQCKAIWNKGMLFSARLLNNYIWIHVVSRLSGSLLVLVRILAPELVWLHTWDIPAGLPLPVVHECADSRFSTVRADWQYGGGVQLGRCYCHPSYV